jgi:DNA modification methylase
MTPYYDDGQIQIWHGDCRDVLPTLPPVDLVLTDPPYGVGIADWDKDVPYDLLPRFLELSRGAVVWFGASARLRDDIGRFLVPPQRTLVWAPSFTLSHTAAHGMAYRWHPIYTWNIPTKHRGPTWDLLTTPTECGNWWRHPATKPLDLFRALIGLAPECGTVLDPYGGSGTTARAAKDMGRSCITIEIEERYCEIAARRLQQSVLPLEMTA